MHARFAHFGDQEPLLSLACQHVAEEHPGLDFHAGIAAHTFHGAPRVDPIVIVLEDGGELVGFLLARFRRMPFCDAEIACQETMFIKPEKRCPEAEAYLLNQFHDFARMAKVAEAHLMVSSNDIAFRLYDHVSQIGYAPVGACMKAVASTARPAAPMGGSTVH